MGIYDDDYGTPEEQAANKRKIDDMLRAELDADGNEFEGMTPRELRNLIRTTQADLRKAVTDRAALLSAMKSVARQAERSDSGLLRVEILDIMRNIELTALKTISEVEGKG